MLDMILNNLATIIISIVLLVVILLILRTIIKDKRNGKSSCGANCACCALHDKCHGKK